MPLVVTNTLTRKKEEFKPLDPDGKKVHWYACGPTVYGPIHIGNARTIVMTDTMRRWLEHLGYDVNFVSNITDIDDKIINKAKEENLTAKQVSEKYEELFFNQISRLGVRKATQHPRATEHIQEQIDLIEGLIIQDKAYVSKDGSVWFHVKSFNDYGKLSRRNLEDMQQGERVDETQQSLKKDPLDFGLWKAAKPGEPSWDSPWGKGRPGWHLECSCMAMACSGQPTIDIHTGGSDLIFPHHENEIAQSEAFSGEPFSRYWFHLAMMNIDGEKISKSLGNVIHVDKLLEKYSPLTVRHLLISAHYRTELNFTEEGLEHAKKASTKYADAYKNAVEFLSGEPNEKAWQASEICNQLDTQFTIAMNDDFNTARAFAVIFDCVSNLNRGIKDKDVQVVSNFASLLIRLRNVLGLGTELEVDTSSVPGDNMTADLIELLIDVRQKARQKKAFDLADEIRDRLNEMGFALEDSPQGTKWKMK